MNTAAEVLLIIVSATLAIFLIVLSVALYFLINLLKDVRKISQKAGSVASAVESAAFAFERTASPLAAIKMVSGIISKVRQHSKKEK